MCQKNFGIDKPTKFNNYINFKLIVSSNAAPPATAKTHNTAKPKTGKKKYNKYNPKDIHTPTHQ